MDLYYLAIVVAVFGLSVLLVYGCEKLRRSA
jgi:hypothetical protein